MLKPKYSKLWYLIGILLLANIIVWAAFYQTRLSNFAKLYFFDVGQGDAIYLRTFEGNDVLIDGGPGDAILSKLGTVMPFTDRTIEFVVLTHPHADHVSGLVEILKRYKVENVLLPRVSYDSATFARFQELLEKNNVGIIRPRLGQRIFLDDKTVFDVYYPFLPEFSKLPEDINDVSVVAKISFGKSNVLLTGDAGKDIESLLLHFDLPLVSEIFKVGHHGSRHSSGSEFLKAAGATYSIISVGKNPYGHPHQEVLELLSAENTKVFRTDQEGDIVFKIYPDRVDKLTTNVQ